MKRESISYYLKNPSKLIDISVSQIEKWLQDSPYSQPLRALLAKKKHFNQEVALGPILAGAATIASNRTWLYRELHANLAYKTKSPSGGEAATEVDNSEDGTSLSFTKEATRPENIEVSIEDHPLESREDYPEVKPEDDDAIDQQVDYEEITSFTTPDQSTQIIENENLLPLVKSIETKSESIEDEDIIMDDQDVSEEDAVDSNKSTSTEKEEIEVELLQNIQDDVPKPLVATLGTVQKTPKLIDLSQDKTHDNSETIPKIQVVRVETDEEFVAGRDDDRKKKKSKKKNKVEKNKPKKDKKKSDKKSDEKDKEKKKKKKSAKRKKKEKKKAKKEAKERKRLKDLDDFWEGREETAPAEPIKKKVVKKKSKGRKKNPKVKLQKYDIPVSPIKEEANHFDINLDEMSNYTQWLLQFSKDKEDGSLSHMTIANSQTRTRIDDFSYATSETKDKKEKKKRKKKSKKKTSAKNKNKSKIDHSLDPNEEIISELWADLLAKQGHIKKARKMYLKLSLKYPEKSSYFAAKLDKL